MPPCVRSNIPVTIKRFSVYCQGPGRWLRGKSIGCASMRNPQNPVKAVSIQRPLGTCHSHPSHMASCSLTVRRCEGPCKKNKIHLLLTPPPLLLKRQAGLCLSPSFPSLSPSLLSIFLYLSVSVSLQLFVSFSLALSLSFILSFLPISFISINSMFRLCLYSAFCHPLRFSPAKVSPAPYHSQGCV